MNPKPLSNVSIYYLLLELLEDGRAGLINGEEGIPEINILQELQKRTGRNFETKAEWAKFFIADEYLGSEIERANLLIFVKTQEAMIKVWNMVNERKNN
jgi:hypothetical protein